MVEAKHKYFLVQNVINKTVSPSNSQEIYASGNTDSITLRYSGRYREFHDITGVESINSTSATTKRLFNFQLLFGPDEILPDNQGTKTDQFVGNKFYWKNTVFSMQFDPTNYVTFMKRIQGQSYGGLMMPRSVETYSVPSHVEEVDLTKYTNINSNGQSLIGDYAYSGVAYPQTLGPVNPSDAGVVLRQTEVLRSSGNVPSKGINVPAQTITPTTNYRLPAVNVDPTTNNAAYKITSTVNAPYNYFPLLMSPQFKLYYYTRIIVFKFRLPMANFNVMYHSWEQQMNFLNHLWWQRNQDITKPNYSIRSSVLNDINPYAGTFQVVYNKLIKVNPTKRYIFRFNFGSRKRKGDLITLKTGDPFNPVPDPEELNAPDHMYSNACYLGFMLPPIHPDDFDFFGANALEFNSPFDPYGRSTRHKMLSVEYPTQVGDPDTWDGPYVPVYDANNQYTGHNVGQTLNLGAIYISGRTCFID